MNTRIYIASCIVLAATIASCKSDKGNAPEDQGATVSTDSRYGASESDTTADASSRTANDNVTIASGAAGGGNYSEPTPGKAARNSVTGKKSGSGYSAPDGTDAENHDGDQYTRNDTARRPTGPPIK